MGDDGEPEVHPGDPGHRLPRAAAVVAAVDPAVVLEVEPLGVAGVAGHLVHALAELEVVSVGHEADDDPPVARLPRRAAVVGAVDAGRGDGDQQALRVVRVDEDGVQAQPTAARLPLRPVRVVPEARVRASNVRPPSSLRNRAAGSTPA